jgi:Family of unknown function (DUF5996)
MRSHPLAFGRGAEEPIPAFYSYAYPIPNGFADAQLAPEWAYFDNRLGEFILPYEVVRKSSASEAMLIAFLQSTYSAAAHLGGWDREALECPIGEPLRPRPLDSESLHGLERAT